MSDNKNLNSRWKDYLTYLENYSLKSFLPFSATFELTPLCNFRCKMCYVRLDKEKQHKSLITLEQWVQLAKSCKEAGVLFLTLTGGEILTYPDFWKLYETLIDMGFFVNLMTNGYLIDSDAIQRLKRRKPYKMRITLYGNNNKTYENICGVKNGYDIVSRNIKLLKDSNINIAVSMTIIKDNRDELSQIAKWTKINNLPFVHTCRIHLPREGVENLAKVVRIIPDNYGENIKILGKYKENNDIVREKLKKNAFCFCGSYRKHFVISWDGYIKGCMSITRGKRNVFEGDLVENFRKVWEYLDNTKIPEKCKNCDYIDFCGFCPGNIAAESGNPELVKPYVCAMAKWNYINFLEKNNIDVTKHCE